MCVSSRLFRRGPPIDLGAAEEETLGAALPPPSPPSPPPQAPPPPPPPCLPPSHRARALEERRPLELREHVAQEVGVKVGLALDDLRRLDLQGVAVLDAARGAREHVVRE